jgi:hypothetical protein
MKQPMKTILEILVRIYSNAGRFGFSLAKTAWLLPIFLITEDDPDENMLEWHIRKYGKSFFYLNDKSRNEMEKKQ